MKKKYTFFFFFLMYFVPVYSKHFVVISKPGSGKGTFSHYMSKKYGYVHIGLGDVTRTRKDNHQSITTKVLNKILKKYIQKTVKNEKEFILDNAITSKDNWQYWKNFFEEKNLVDDIYFIVLDASDETCISRMKDRIICRKCFNVTKKTKGVPVSEHICKDCGNTLTIRTEDHDQQFLQERFEKYHRIIEPIIKKIEKSYKMVRISSEQPLSDMYKIYDQLHNL